MKQRNLAPHSAAVLRAVGAAAILAATSSADAAPRDPKAARLVDRLVSKVGSMADLHQRRDVQYTYVYRTPDGKADISEERYLFNGELSWARYPIHDVFALPGAPGEVVMAVGPSGPWVTAGGKRMTDPQMVGAASFLRPTNFYWFAMFQKLQDPGVNLEPMSPQTVNGTKYERVKMTFDSQGAAKTDDYVLYFNPRTGLVDQFLFSVRGAGIEGPFLMKVEFENVDGLLLPTRRKYAAADWTGKVTKEAWTDEIMLGVHFNNGFKPADFAPPSAR